MQSREVAYQKYQCRNWGTLVHTQQHFLVGCTTSIVVYTCLDQLHSYLYPTPLSRRITDRELVKADFSISWISGCLVHESREGSNYWYRMLIVFKLPQPATDIYYISPLRASCSTTQILFYSCCCFYLLFIYLAHTEQVKVLYFKFHINCPRVLSPEKWAEVLLLPKKL